MNFKLLLFIFILFTTINSTAQTQKSNYKTQQQEKKAKREELNGSVLNQLNFKDINDKEHSLESLRGKVVVLDFWFIQCKPCVKQFPSMNTLKKKYKGKPVEFFAVTWNSEYDVKQFLKTIDLQLTPVVDNNLIDKFNIPHYPYHVIIDQNGKVEFVSSVLSFSITNKLERKINRLLKN
ncbi:TlpA disulfide reductase family protein [uncultured Nonlabens sp.]|uniref:TlpA family protein disulfide reductase n=1 Tax=uncultured Nonlabens sp. TaxID=859306 RepID=UPI002638BB58|nr:TlpA disulfide reductase family protein [uncultured Nonlabens sp.]